VPIANFLLALIAIFVAAKLFGELASRVGQPAVLGELVGGLVVGVSGLQLVDPSNDTIHLLAQLGIVLLLFLIGLQTDLKQLMRVGPAAVIVAIAGVAVTFAGGYGLGTLLRLPPMVALFLGASLTATSVGITARVLSDLGHLADIEAQVILAAAVVDDILGIILLTLLGNGGGVVAITRTAAIAFGFVAVALIVGSLLAPHLLRLIERIVMARGLFFFSLVFALALAYLAERAGTAIIIGSFAAGLILAQTEKGKEIERQVNDVVNFFVPIFFVAVGAALDIGAVSGRFVAIGIALALVAMIGKFGAGLIAPGRGLRRGVIGVGMFPRGEVSLIFAQVGLASGLLSQGLFGSITIMVVITAFITPILLRRLLTQSVPEEPLAACDVVTEAPMEDDVTEASRESYGTVARP
jgi:Kef-type K+ transport system membrane component KefB